MTDTVSLAMSDVAPRRTPEGDPDDHFVAPKARGKASPNLRSTLSEVEKHRTIEALESTEGNQTTTAQVLGVSGRMLINRIEAYNLPHPRKRS